MAECVLTQHIEEIGLILVVVISHNHLVSGAIPSHTGIVAGSNTIGTQVERML